MSKKLKLILVVLVISTSTLIESSITTGGGLKSVDFCKNELLTSKCLEKHSVKCEEESICSINNEQCDRFNLISKLFDKKMLRMGKQYKKNMNSKEEQFAKFKQSIPVCNGIGDLNESTFECLKNLKELRLSKNNLNKIDFIEVFSVLKNLTYLDLSYNLIDNLNFLKMTENKQNEN